MCLSGSEGQISVALISVKETWIFFLYSAPRVGIKFSCQLPAEDLFGQGEEFLLTKIWHSSFSSMMQATQDLNVATSVPNYFQSILKNFCLQLE